MLSATMHIYLFLSEDDIVSLGLLVVETVSINFSRRLQQYYDLSYLNTQSLLVPNFCIENAAPFINQSNTMPSRRGHHKAHI